LKVNHSVDRVASDSITHRVQKEGLLGGVYPIVAAMLVYSILAYGNVDGYLGGAAILLTSVVAYFLTMYVYYGIARLAYQGYTHLLLGGAVAAVIVSLFMSGLSAIWAPLAGWVMLLLAGAATGRLTHGGYLQGQVYVIGAAVVAILFTLQSIPIWNKFLQTAPRLGEAFAQQVQLFLVGLGYSAEMIQGDLEQSRKVFDVLVRLFPAATILGALLQFSIGYLAFVLWVGRKDPSRRCYVPIILWKVPFGFAPVLIVAILVRFVGGEPLRMIADNALTVLAVYYCVAGLALIEYYLKKLHVSRLTKVLFYLLLFLTQLVGFFAVALVGFVDSFFDWRKVKAPEIL